MKTGLVTVRPLHGKIASREDHFDLFLKIHFGKNVKQSPIYEHSNKNPTWDFLTQFHREHEDRVEVEVFEVKGSDNFIHIGKSEILMSEVFNKNNSFDKWCEIKNKNKVVGEMYLEVSFIPDNQDPKIPDEFIHTNYKIHSK